MRQSSPINYAEGFFAAIVATTIRDGHTTTDRTVQYDICRQESCQAQYTPQDSRALVQRVTRVH